MTGTPLQRHRQRIDRRHVARTLLNQHKSRQQDAWRDLIALFRENGG